jgi:hypothetical protein
MRKKPELVVDDSQKSGPWWLVAIQRLGPITVIALGLVWFLKHDVAEGMTKIQTTVDRHVLDMRVDQTQTIYYLQAICLNAADDEDERARCHIVVPDRPVVDPRP